MVTLSSVQSSNSQIASTFPRNLVAVFVGATSGIGEATLKQFAKHSRQPRAYFIGRSQDAGDRILSECRALNSEGEYIFIKADVSLLHAVDTVCEQIKAKEKAINVLFLSAGVAIMDRRGNSSQAVVTAATRIRDRRLTTCHRNIRAYPFADRLGLLLPLPLHDQPPPSHSVCFEPPSRHYRRKRRV